MEELRDGPLDRTDRGCFFRGSEENADSGTTLVSVASWHVCHSQTFTAYKYSKFDRLLGQPEIFA